MSKLTLSIVQHHIIWENPLANRSILEEKIHDLNKYGDLILLPETFTTGFTSNVEKLAEPMNFTTHKWMKQIAAHTQAFIGGSVIIREDNNVFNRFLLVSPEGETQFYDKKHLFRMSREREVFTPGNERKLMKVKDWTICPLVCYDLRFPVWSRNSNLAYDLLIYSANWPAPRDFVWNTLLFGRALENQAYVVGINRVGTDGEEITYLGNSQAISAKGNSLFETNSKETIFQVTLDKKELIDFRLKFPVHLDADRFDLI